MKLSLKRLFYKRVSPLAKEVMGLYFPNPVGLRCGALKGADRYNSSSNLRYGFIETGPFTPHPQLAEKKRPLFRNRQTIPNTNSGVKYIIDRIQRNKPDMILSVQILHNNSSVDEDNMGKDYLEAFSMVYDFADMISIDSSATNPDKSHPLQDPSFLSDILDSLLEMRLYYDTYKPIILKIASDISSDILEEIVHYCLMSGIDAICVINKGNTIRTIESINAISKSRIPVIVEGRTLSPSDVTAFISAGATLLQTTRNWWQRGNTYANKLISAVESAAIRK